jgi:putative ABC transport system permease protein
MDMLLNYLKVAVRSLFRSKLTAFINIAGLASAMACSLLIALFIRDEISYDRYHSKADRIYRVTRNFLSPDGTANLHLGHLAPPFGPLLKNDFTEFEEVIRTLRTGLLVAWEKDGERVKAFNEPNCFFVEHAIFNVFDIKVTEGDGPKTLSQPFQLMISEKTAARYFGEGESAVGKTLRLANAFDVAVGGVFKDFPAQSHWHPDFFLSFSTLNDPNIYGKERLETNWGNNAFSTYVLATEPLDIARIESQFPAFLDRHMGSGEAEASKPSTWTNLFLQKLTDIHLHSHLDSEIEANGNINNVYMMGVIGIFIILIACFNFINLSTARATKRAKEVGLRKVVGAFRAQLIWQYLGESILIAFLSLILAVGVAYVALPWLNTFTNKQMTLALVENGIGLYLIAFTCVTGILAGIYPAFVISSFRPSAILKGGHQGSTGSRGTLRQVLVVPQFSIGIVLIIATFVTYRQLQFINNRDLGYVKDQVVQAPLFNELTESYEAFRNELLKHSSISSVGRSSRVPTTRLLDSQGPAQIQKGDSLANTEVVLKNISVDHHFFETYQIPLVAGRNFSEDIKTDDSLAFILNESAVKMMNLTSVEVVGRDIKYGEVKGRIIGVVRDFHFESLHEPIVPVIFHQGPTYGNMSLRVAAANIKDAINHFEKVWKEFLPDRPFQYTFISERYAQLYAGEQKQGQLFVVFSLLAIAIASLGLFGLATFNTIQRIKEIGIRKVLGASVGNIVSLLSKEMLILILIANLVAWPIAWYFTNEWLGTFAYRIPNDPLLYILAAIAAICVALLTVGTQTLKAALSNPAETLRNE